MDLIALIHAGSGNQVLTFSSGGIFSRALVMFSRKVSTVNPLPFLFQLFHLHSDQRDIVIKWRAAGPFPRGFDDALEALVQRQAHRLFKNPEQAVLPELLALRIADLEDRRAGGFVSRDRLLPRGFS
jgi:hypothetical protein